MVCETRNYTETARQLGITQSAVTQSIKTLEDRFHIALFDRSVRPMKLNEEAMYLKLVIEKNMHQLIDAGTLLRSQNYVKPILRIGLLDSIASELGPDLLKALSSYSREVVLRSGTSARLYELLQRGEVDLVVTGEAYRHVKSLIREFILAESPIVMMPKTVVLSKERWTWGDLQKCSLPTVRFLEESESGHMNAVMIEKFHLSFPERLDVDGIDMAYKMVESGMGWALTYPLSVSKIHAYSKRVSISQAPTTSIGREIYVVGKPNANERWLKLLTKLTLEIIKNKILPPLIEELPWTKETFRFTEKVNS